MTVHSGCQAEKMCHKSRRKVGHVTQAAYIYKLYKDIVWLQNIKKIYNLNTIFIFYFFKNNLRCC